MPVKTRAKKTTAPRVNVVEISKELQHLQRSRVIVVKSRIMAENRLRAVVACDILGYKPKDSEVERKQKHKEAQAIIDRVVKGEENNKMTEVILATMLGIEAFDKVQGDLDRTREDWVKQLPICAWIKLPAQKGIDFQTLATVIGECGDLRNYAHHSQMWKRLGCAPWTWDGKTLMGSTWRGHAAREGKLPAEEWERYGYSPRRRSISYVIGHGLMMQNGQGPYRARFEEEKTEVQKLHPDYPKGRCQLHGELCAVKLFYKRLWRQWRDLVR